MRIPLPLFRAKDKRKVAKCQIKPKDFVQARKKAYDWKLRLYPLFWDLNESEKSPLSLPQAENGVFLQKNLKKTKKVLDKPARILYSFAVDKKQ
jgi:hypothetical protein